MNKTGPAQLKWSCLHGTYMLGDETGKRICFQQDEYPLQKMKQSGVRQMWEREGRQSLELRWSGEKPLKRRRLK